MPNKKQERLLDKLRKFLPRYSLKPRPLSEIETSIDIDRYKKAYPALDEPIGKCINCARFFYEKYEEQVVVCSEKCAEEYINYLNNLKDSKQCQR